MRAAFEALKQEQEQYGWSNKEFLDILHGVIKRHGNKSDEPQGILYTYNMINQLTFNDCEIIDSQ